MLLRLLTPRAAIGLGTACRISEDSLQRSLTMSKGIQILGLCTKLGQRSISMVMR